MATRKSKCPMGHVPCPMGHGIWGMGWMGDLNVQQGDIFSFFQ